MRVALFVASILFFGAACNTPVSVQQLPEQKITPIAEPNYNLFVDDELLFVDAEEVITSTVHTPSTTETIVAVPATATTSPVVKAGLKKKVASSHGTIVIPKDDPPPLPPKNVPKQVVKKVQEEPEYEDEEYEEEGYEEAYEQEEEEVIVENEEGAVSCEPNWECTDWSACTSSGQRSYSCTDLNGCMEEYVSSGSCKPPSKLTRGPYNVAITGSNTECKNNTVKAINLLKTLPSFYQFFITYVGEINCIPQASRMDVYKDPPRFQVGYKTAGDGDVWYASVLVHEACHSKQYRDYVYAHNSFDVPQDLYFGYNAEYQCNQEQKKTLIALGAEQYLIDSMDDMSSEWWKLSEEEQTW